MRKYHQFYPIGAIAPKLLRARCKLKNIGLRKKTQTVVLSRVSAPQPNECVDPGDHKGSELDFKITGTLVPFNGTNKFIETNLLKLHFSFYSSHSCITFGDEEGQKLCAWASQQAAQLEQEFLAKGFRLSAMEESH